MTVMQNLRINKTPLCSISVLSDTFPFISWLSSKSLHLSFSTSRLRSSGADIFSVYGQTDCVCACLRVHLKATSLQSHYMNTDVARNICFSTRKREKKCNQHCLVGIRKKHNTKLHRHTSSQISSVWANLMWHIVTNQYTNPLLLLKYLQRSASIPICATDAKLYNETYCLLESHCLHLWHYVTKRSIVHSNNIFIKTHYLHGKAFKTTLWFLPCIQSDFPALF